MALASFDNLSWFSKLRRTLSSVPLPMMGACLIRTWVRCATPLFPDGAVFWGLSTSNIFDVTCALTALSLALASKVIGEAYRKQRLTLVATIFMVIASLSIGLAVTLDLPWLASPLAVLAGIGFMTMSLVWCTLYMSFNPIRMIMYYCLSQLLSNILIFALNGYQPPHMYGVLTLLPLFSLLCLRKSASLLGANDKPLARQNVRPFPWKPALFLMTYSLAYSIAEASSGVLSGYPQLFLYLIPPALFLVGVIFEPKYFSLRTIYLVVCPVMMCALLLPVAIPNLPGELSAALVSLGYSTSSLLGILILGSISYRLGISALWLVGTTRACSYMGMYLGDLCHQMLDTASGNLTPALAALLAVCVVISSTMLLTEKGINANWRMSPSEQTTSGNEDSGPLVTIAQARDLYGLTDREEEVLYLLVQKKSVPVIAADMFLAQGTVKAHVQHIYQKMGVHSRKELEEALHI